MPSRIVIRHGQIVHGVQRRRIILTEFFAPEVNGSLKDCERLWIQTQPAVRFTDRVEERRFDQRLCAERLIELADRVIEEIDNLDRPAIHRRIGPPKRVDQEAERMLGTVRSSFALFLLASASSAFEIARIRCRCSSRRAASSFRQASESKGTATPSAASATTTAAAQPATSGWWRRTHRRARSGHGSRQADTGSSASQRSMSAARLRAD